MFLQEMQIRLFCLFNYFRANGNVNLGFQAVSPKEIATSTHRSAGKTGDTVIAFSAKPDALVTTTEDILFKVEDVDVRTSVELPLITVEVSRK